MTLTVDHAVYATSAVDETRERFESAGLTTAYGGTHDNGVTEMAIVGFPDRSYVELIAERDERAEEPHDYWPERIRADAGPTAWAVRVENAVDDARRALAAGEIVHGPFTEGRDREDGRRVEWDRVRYGPDDRSLVPFAIADRTPLARRVEPTGTPEPVRGIGQVVLATPEPTATVARLRDRYRLATPASATVPGVGEVRSFPGAPIAVVGPGEAWIDDRLDAHRPMPCGYLLAVESLAAARDHLPLGESVAWPDGRAAPLDPFGWRLAVVDR